MTRNRLSSPLDRRSQIKLLDLCTEYQGIYFKCDRLGEFWDTVASAVSCDFQVLCSGKEVETCVEDICHEAKECLIRGERFPLRAYRDDLATVIEHWLEVEGRRKLQRGAAEMKTGYLLTFGHDKPSEEHIFTNACSHRLRETTRKIKTAISQKGKASSRASVLSVRKIESPGSKTTQQRLASEDSHAHIGIGSQEKLSTIFSPYTSTRKLNHACSGSNQTNPLGTVKNADEVTTPKVSEFEQRTPRSRKGKHAQKRRRVDNDTSKESTLEPPPTKKRFLERTSSTKSKKTPVRGNMDISLPEEYPRTGGGRLDDSTRSTAAVSDLEKSDRRQNDTDGGWTEELHLARQGDANGSAALSPTTSRADKKSKRSRKRKSLRNKARRKEYNLGKRSPDTASQNVSQISQASPTSSSKVMLQDRERESTQSPFRDVFRDVPIIDLTQSPSQEKAKRRAEQILLRSEGNVNSDLVSEGPPLQSIEEGPRNHTSPKTPAGIGPRSGLDGDGELQLAGPSPSTQRKLQHYEEIAIKQLEGHKRVAGGRVSLLELTQNCLGQDPPTSLLVSVDSRAAPRGNVPQQPQPREGGWNDSKSSFTASHAKDIEKPKCQQVSTGFSSHASVSKVKDQTKRGVGITPRISDAARKQGSTRSKFLGGQSFSERLFQVRNKDLGTPNQQSQEPVSHRAGTPAELRQFNADEARKRQKPLAPLSIPYRSSPVRKQSPKLRRSTKNRIDPSKFYGPLPLERAIVGKDELPAQQLNLKPDQPTSGACPNTEPHSRRGDEAKTTLDSLAKATSSECEQSDSESLPDIEELYQRYQKAAGSSNNPSASQEGSSEQQDVRVKGDVVSSSVSSQAKKRSRQRPTLESPDEIAIGSLQSAAVTKSLGIGSDSDKHPAKRRKRSELGLDACSRPVPEPDEGPGPSSNPPRMDERPVSPPRPAAESSDRRSSDRRVTRAEHARRRSGKGDENKSKPEKPVTATDSNVTDTDRHNQDDHPVSSSNPPAKVGDTPRRPAPIASTTTISTCKATPNWGAGALALALAVTMVTLGNAATAAIVVAAINKNQKGR